MHDNFCRIIRDYFQSFSKGFQIIRRAKWYIVYGCMICIPRSCDHRVNLCHVHPPLSRCLLKSSLDSIPSNAATSEVHGASEKAAELLHLPPISLYFQLPMTYPYHDPPSYTLSCKWINFSSVSVKR